MLPQNENGVNPMVQDDKSKTDDVSLPIELQVEFAKLRSSLAKERYDISVREGRSWNVDENDTHRP